MLKVSFTREACSGKFEVNTTCVMTCIADDISENPLFVFINIIGKFAKYVQLNVINYLVVENIFEHSFH